MSRLFARLKNEKKIDLPELAPELTWITVREELSIKEERDTFGGSVKGQTQLPDGATRTDFDLSRVSFAPVIAYLVDWDAKDEAGKSVDCTPDAVYGLLRSTYTVIEDAVNAHIEGVRPKKKTPAKTKRGEATSLSVVG